MQTEFFGSYECFQFPQALFQGMVGVSALVGGFFVVGVTAALTGATATTEAAEELKVVIVSLINFGIHVRAKQKNRPRRDGRLGRFSLSEVALTRTVRS